MTGSKFAMQNIRETAENTFAGARKDAGHWVFSLTLLQLSELSEPPNISGEMAGNAPCVAQRATVNVNGQLGCR